MDESGISTEESGEVNCNAGLSVLTMSSYFLNINLIVLLINSVDYVGGGN